MRNEIALTTEEILARMEEESSACGLEENELVFTRETFADFLKARESYSDDGERDMSVGDDVLKVIGVQALKGQPRKDLTVVDFGTVRVAVLV